MDENQRRRRKELQAKITALKKSVPKGDRKKKEFIEQISQLQAELDAEIEDDVGQNKNSVHEISAGVESLCTAEVGSNNAVKASSTVRQSKAQKRRDKKAAKENEREQKIAEQERENLGGSRHVENEKIKSILKSKGLAIYEIPSNGDCLYAAVTHQLETLGAPSKDVKRGDECTKLSFKQMSVASLRQQTAGYMRNHPNTFLPFLCDQDTGEQLTIEKYEKYCNDTEESSTWGGQPELQAISHVLQLSIEVIQAEGAAIILGEEYQHHPRLILIYHRHMYGLGEHYNSVTSETENTADEEFTQK